MKTGKQIIDEYERDDKYHGINGGDLYPLDKRIDDELEKMMIPYECLVKTDKELIQLATKSCIDANGIENWNTMWSGNQESEIESFIAGYNACIESESQRPYFTISESGWGGSWEAGDTIKLPDPRLEFLWDMYQKLKNSDIAVCDTDEVKYFYDWVVEKTNAT